jgi:hypothetical protein
MSWRRSSKRSLGWSRSILVLQRGFRGQRTNTPSRGTSGTTGHPRFAIATRDSHVRARRTGLPCHEKEQVWGSEAWPCRSPLILYTTLWVVYGRFTVSLSRKEHDRETGRSAWTPAPGHGSSVDGGGCTGGCAGGHFATEDPDRRARY